MSTRLKVFFVAVALDGNFGLFRESETKARFRTIQLRQLFGEPSGKKYNVVQYISVIAFSRAHRGRDFALGLAGIRELRALEVAPRSSIL